MSSFSAGLFGVVISKLELPVLSLDLGEPLDIDELLLDVTVGSGELHDLLSLALTKKTIIKYPSISDTLYNKSHLN